MAPRNVPKSVATARSRVASLTRSRPVHDPEFVAARRDLASANIQAYVEKVVSAAPPLTIEQIDAIAALLRRPAGAR